MNTRVRGHRVPVGSSVRYWLDETCWLELADPDPAVDECLRRSDGWNPDQTLRRRLSPEQAGQAEALLSLLREHRLAARGGADAPLAGLRLALCGSGPLARLVAQALVRGGARHLDVVDPSPPDPLAWPGSRHRDGAHALAGALRPRTQARVRPVPGLAALAEHRTDLVLVVPGAVEADRVVLDELVSLDLSHLLVAADGDTGRLGPVVLPGRTPCMRCHDLARSRQDPSWPTVLAHLAGAPARPHPTMGAHLASRAVLEVGWLARDVECAGRLAGRVEHLDLATPATRVARFAPDPDCTCRWRP